MTTTTTATTTKQPFPPFLLVLAGMLIGSSNGALSYLQWFRAHAESILLTVYTCSVALYLAYAFVVVKRRPAVSKQVKQIPSREPPQRVLTESSVASSSTAATTATEEPELVVDEQQQQQQQLANVVNLTGAYKLQSNHGFEDFLAVQGVPWALRRAANAARPLHRITHGRDNNQLTIQIEGIIESSTTYTINGPPVETNVRGRIFEDSVAYNETGNGIVVSKRAITEDYNVRVERILSDDKQQITLTSTAIFKDGKDPVKSVQIFKRVE